MKMAELLPLKMYLFTILMSLDSGKECLKVYGYTPSFTAMFSKGDNFRDFLFANWEDKITQNGVHF